MFANSFNTLRNSNICNISIFIKYGCLRDEKFYEKVKKILLEEGEISNAIGRLTNKSEFELLSYDERQRYTLSLSERYVKAVERFNHEKSLGIID